MPELITGTAGKPHLTSTQHRAIYEKIIGEGSYIFDDNELLEPELQSNQSLRIRSGMLYHHGSITEVKQNTYDEVAIANGSQGMKRIDLVVLRYTRNPETEIEKMEWVVIQGTPAASDPAVPAYTEGNMQEGDLTDDCPVFEVHLDGIQVTKVVKLLAVYKRSLEELYSSKIEQLTLPVKSAAFTDAITRPGVRFFEINSTVADQIGLPGNPSSWWYVFHIAQPDGSGFAQQFFYELGGKNRTYCRRSTELAGSGWGEWQSPFMCDFTQIETTAGGTWSATDSGNTRTLTQPITDFKMIGFMVIENSTSDNISHRQIQWYPVAWLKSMIDGENAYRRKILFNYTRSETGRRVWVSMNSGSYTNFTFSKANAGATDSYSLIVFGLN